jgi:hypothetical protein
MTHVYTVGQPPFYRDPGSRKLGEIPPRTLLEAADVPTQAAHSKTWRRVCYRDTWGWVQALYVEGYQYPFAQNVVLIEQATADKYDVAQNWTRPNGRTAFNACGPLAVAFCAGVSLGNAMDVTQVKQPPLWRRVFLNDSTTGVPTLHDMLLYLKKGYRNPIRYLQVALRDAEMPYTARVTPERMARLCFENYLITAVKVSPDGYLAKTGIPHWVVVTHVMPYGIDNGAVSLYNPMTNAEESYSWRELKASMGSPNGLVVAK